MDQIPCGSWVGHCRNLFGAPLHNPGELRNPRQHDANPKPRDLLDATVPPNARRGRHCQPLLVERHLSGVRRDPGALRAGHDLRQVLKRTDDRRATGVAASEVGSSLNLRAH